ncbi:hypothetical protein B0H17DRAFT_1196716 [Mycena rosella]|uniref:Uncharacterized protein n=1 Tax=Mycena rosella TaxID=1033263 RepID=A0AAD7GN02_MYCRO|nr:hypothetical protein B0H17DRAFT_1196716 [Mycena rosella]
MTLSVDRIQFAMKAAFIKYPRERRDTTGYHDASAPSRLTQTLTTDAAAGVAFADRAILSTNVHDIVLADAPSDVGYAEGTLSPDTVIDDLLRQLREAIADAHGGPFVHTFAVRPSALMGSGGLRPLLHGLRCIGLPVQGGVARWVDKKNNRTQWRYRVDGRPQELRLKLNANCIEVRVDTLD